MLLGGRGGALARVGGAHLDPAAEVVDDRVGELRLGRHLHVALVADGGQEQAFLGISRHDGGPGLAALARGVPGVERQAALRLARLGRVALVALFDEDGADLALEELDAFGVRVGGARAVRPGGPRHRRGEGRRIAWSDLGETDQQAGGRAADEGRRAKAVRRTRESVPPPRPEGQAPQRNGAGGIPLVAGSRPCSLVTAPAAAAVPTAATAPTAAAVLARLGLVDGQRPAAGLLAVEGRDGRLGLLRRVSSRRSRSPWTGRCRGP